ncbi:MAG: SPOR domain-containing protein, partial [Poseidonibacter sp.]|uniref:SPOR domain-containing protein n=1 Tax=Poseidonibacter sp. TaxID=2321188 RepID=UPI00359D2F9C
VVKVNIPKPKVKIQIKEKIIEKIRQVKKEKVFQTDEVFKDKFLLADDKSFTINISSFTTLKDLEVLVKKYKLEENSFFFNYGDNTKLIKLVYGVFDTYEKANNKLKELSELKGTYFPIIERIASVKNLYNENIEINTKVEKKLEYEYIDLSSLENKEEIKINTSERLNKLDESEYKALEVNVESIVENKVNNQISSSFKERFLATPRNHYTINLASFENISIANEFIEKHNLFDEVFYVYTSKGKVKLMYKIFSTFKDISLAVQNLPDSLRRNNPFIQKIHRSQDLYVKNNVKWE